MKSRLFKAHGVREPMKIGNVDQLNGRRGCHATLAGRHRVGAQIAVGDQPQATVRYVIEIGAVGKCDIEIDLLGVAG